MVGATEKQEQQQHRRKSTFVHGKQVAFLKLVAPTLLPRRQLVVSVYIYTRRASIIEQQQEEKENLQLVPDSTIQYIMEPGSLCL